MSTPRRRAIVAMLVERDGSACQLCGVNPAVEPSIDHRYPVSKYPDREWEADNWRIACQRCNSSRGNRIQPGDPESLGELSRRWTMA